MDYSISYPLLIYADFLRRSPIYNNLLHNNLNIQQRSWAGKKGEMTKMVPLGIVLWTYGQTLHINISRFKNHSAIEVILKVNLNF